MSFLLEDGSGTGQKAKVDVDNRLQVKSKSVSSFSIVSAETEQSYYFASNFIPIATTGSFSAILYVKNTDTTKLMCIQQMRTCGQVAQQWELIFNPTAGTIIDDATTGRSANLNLRSANDPVANIYSGADSKTITGGNIAAQWINNTGHSNTNFDGAIIIGPNDSVALQVKPGASSDVCATLLVTFEPIP